MRKGKLYNKKHDAIVKDESAVSQSIKESVHKALDEDY